MQTTTLRRGQCQQLKTQPPGVAHRLFKRTTVCHPQMKKPSDC